MKDVIDLDKSNPIAILRRIARLGFLPVAIIFLGLIAIFTSIYQVPADSNAVILRFGKYTKTVD